MSPSGLAADVTGPLQLAEPSAGGWSLSTRVVVYLLVLLPAAGGAAALGAAVAGGGSARVATRLAGYLAVLALCFAAAYGLGSWTRPGWLR